MPDLRPAGSFQEQANLAWERFNPDKVSVPESERDRAAWISGYLAALQDAGFEDAARSAVPGIDSQGGGAFGRERESASLAAPHKAEAHDA